MTAPGEIPPAFRRRGAGGFIGQDDAAVLKAAAVAMSAVMSMVIGSPARAEQWQRFDDAMGELASRGMHDILTKLRDRGELVMIEMPPDHELPS